jgi:hypothetical protein
MLCQPGVAPKQEIDAEAVDQVFGQLGRFHTDERIEFSNCKGMGEAERLVEPDLARAIRCTNRSEPACS